VAVVEQAAVCPDGLESAARAVDLLEKTAKKPRDFPEIQLFRWARVAESPQVAQAVQWVAAQGRSTRAVTVERAMTQVVAVVVGMVAAVVERQWDKPGAVVAVAVRRMWRCSTSRTRS
jgi:hypothetical protein